MSTHSSSTSTTARRDSFYPSKRRTHLLNSHVPLKSYCTNHAKQYVRDRPYLLHPPTNSRQPRLAGLLKHNF